MKYTLQGHKKTVSTVAFSPVGQLLASGCIQQIILWDTSTGKLQKLIEACSDAAYCLAFSPDGKQIALGSSDCGIKLWSTASGALQQILTSHTGFVTSVAFSSDGRLIASGSADKTIKLWEVSPRTLQQTTKGFSKPVASVVFSSDGKYLISSSENVIRPSSGPSGDEMIKLWDVSSGVVQQTFKAESHITDLAAFSPDSKQLAVVVDSVTINLWTISWSLQQSLRESWNSHGISFLAFSPNGKLLASASSNGIVELWNTTKGSFQHLFQRHFSSSMAFSPDSELLALAGESVRIWTTGSGILQSTFVEGSSPIVFSPNGRNLVSSDESQTIKLWDVSSGALLHSIGGKPCGSHLAISPDGKLLASVSQDQTLRLWDTCTWALQQTRKLPYCHKLKFHPTKPVLMLDEVLIWIEQSERGDPSMPSKWGKTLSVMDDWITLNGENLLHLPSEYYAPVVGFQAGLLALGHKSGRISLLEFDLMKLEQM